jgi:hypothetical protein
MLLRKVNAVLSIICTVLILDHAIFLSVWMLSRCNIAKSENFIPIILMILVVAHAIISIVLGVIGHKNAEKRKCKEYPKLNVSTIIQRASGILMILLLVLHIVGATNYYQPKILHAVLHPLFFAIVLSHVAVSGSKAIITLGIGSAKVVKVVDVVIKVICIATFIASVIGFYLCLFVGVAK